MSFVSTWMGQVWNQQKHHEQPFNTQTNCWLLQFYPDYVFFFVNFILLTYWHKRNNNHFDQQKEKWLEAIASNTKVKLKIKHLFLLKGEFIDSVCFQLVHQINMILNVTLGLINEMRYTSGELHYKWMTIYCV